MGVTNYSRASLRVVNLLNWSTCCGRNSILLGVSYTIYDEFGINIFGNFLRQRLRYGRCIEYMTLRAGADWMYTAIIRTFTGAFELA